uniref:Lens epithelial protein n=1 Tax=Podarcis muralis TaxID=64176 RepID=A0A670JIP5_PODMU
MFAAPRPWVLAALTGPYFGRPRAARPLALPYYKSGNVVSLGYWALQALRECLYVLLCCWCLKEILD